MLEGFPIPTAKNCVGHQNDMNMLVQQNDRSQEQYARSYISYIIIPHLPGEGC